MAAGDTVHGKDVVTLFDSVNLSGESMESGWDTSIDTAARPRRGQDRIGYLSGHEDGKYSLSGYVRRTPATDDLEAKFQGLPEAVAVVLESFGPSGRGCFGEARVAGLEMATPGEDKATIKGDLQLASGVRPCEMLARPQEVAIPAAMTTVTEETTAHDGGASSSQGGAACLQIYETDATGTVTVTVEHADAVGGAYTTVASFAVVAAGELAAQIVEIAPATDGIKRFVRAKIVVNGAATNAVKFAVGLERR